MSRLPTPELMARLVTGVTNTMYGISFRVAARPFVDEQRCKVGMLVISGAAPVAVVMSSNSAGCTQLASAMFSCAPGDVDSAMMDDSLRELLNMTAGQITQALKLDAALGLPHILDGAGMKRDSDGWLRVYLRSTSIELEVCVSDNPEDWTSDKSIGSARREDAA